MCKLLLWLLRPTRVWHWHLPPCVNLLEGSSAAAVEVARRTVNGLKFRPESQAWMGRAGGESKVEWRFTAAQQCLNPRHAWSRCPVAITSLSFHQHAHCSQPALTGSSCRWTGVGAGATVSCLRPRLCFSCQSRRAWAVICCIARAQCWSAGQATAIRCSRFLQESSRFHSRKIGNEKVR